MENLLHKYSFSRLGFDWIIGQGKVIQLLQGLVINGLHTFGVSFIAPYGCGKSELAKLLVKILLCSSRKENCEPCGICEGCLAIDRINSICSPLSAITVHSVNSDLYFCDCPKMQIDDYRNLFRWIGSPSFFSNTNIVLLDEFHRTSSQIRDMFLIEIERYSNTKWIFCVAEDKLQNIEDSFLQRSITFRLRLPEEKDVVGLLKKICQREGIIIDDEEVFRLIALNSGYVPRVAIQNLQKLVLSGTNLTAKTVAEIL